MRKALTVVYLTFTIGAYSHAVKMEIPGSELTAFERCKKLAAETLTKKGVYYAMCHSTSEGWVYSAR